MQSAFKNNSLKALGFIIIILSLFTFQREQTTNINDKPRSLKTLNTSLEKIEYKVQGSERKGVRVTQ